MSIGLPCTRIQVPDDDLCSLITNQYQFHLSWKAFKKIACIHDRLVISMLIFAAIQANR